MFTAETSTSAHVFDPEEAFRQAAALNSELGLGNSQTPIGVEIYPFHRQALAVLRGLAGRFKLVLPVPRSIDSRDIEKWQNIHKVAVSRVHLPYSYDLKEAVRRPLVESNRGFSQRFFLLVYLLFFEPATNNYALKIGQNLHQQRGEKVEGTFHANVAQGFINSGRMAEIRESLNVLVEPSLPFPSLILKREALSVPSVTARKVVEANDLDGLLLNADHLTEGNRLASALTDPAVRRTTRVVHVRVGDLATVNLLRTTDFVHSPVKVVVEGNPFDKKNYSSRLRTTIEAVLH